MEEELIKVDIERINRVGKPKQNKKKYRPIVIKFEPYKCRQMDFLIKKELKITGLSVKERLTAKYIEITNNAKEHFGVRNVWTLEERIYYLTEGCRKL